MSGTARMSGGCSASFISRQGLVMTDHHCIAHCVEQLSSGARDHLRDGFLATGREQELRCPEIELHQLEKIEDVTVEVQHATAGLDGADFKHAYNAIAAKLTSTCAGNSDRTIRCDVVDLYHGGRYHLYRYRRYQDTRLVWAPEKAIAFFGGNLDNFNFPRYNLDAALLRVYEDDKPALIKDFLPFSQNQVKEHELVFTAGYPITTQRQLTLSQLATVRDLGLIDELLRLAELRGVITQYSQSSAEAARTTETLRFAIENTYKLLSGRLGALLDPSLMKQKETDEIALQRFVAGNAELKDKIGGAWDAIDRAQGAYRQFYKAYNALERGRGFFSGYFNYAQMLVRGAQERSRPDGERLPEFVESQIPGIEQALFAQAPLHAELEKVKLTFSLTKLREWLGADAPIVRQLLGTRSPAELSSALIDATRLGDPAVRKALWQGGSGAIARSDDSFIKLALAIDPAARAVRQRYEREVASVEQKNAALIAQARFAQQGTSTYPDATFTLRLSYGEVAGWRENGNWIPPFTTIGGAFKHESGSAPFALPPSWHAVMGHLNLSQPFNFTTTNDIIGGNSGSPVLNARGEIVGLIFDGNVHSLGGAFRFDPDVNRAIAVHNGAILEALGNVYGAAELVREMTTPEP